MRALSIIILIFLSLVSCGNSDVNNPVTGESFVDKHGQLSINGSKLVDNNGDPVALRGMSLFWSQWGGVYYNAETLKWLRDDWKCTIVRAAMGVESGGYLANQATEYQKIKTVIEAAIQLGIYVVVDWHDHHAEQHTNKAVEFFDNISKTYGKYPNIIYEIYNEPLDIPWDTMLKPYAQTVINAIRKNDSDNLIVVGTPNWSQDVDKIIGNKLDGINIAYSFHFYTGTHKQWLRDKAISAMNSGVPIFVTEWGVSEATGDGIIDINETSLWMKFLEDYNLSWCNWSLNNKDETASALLPSTSALSGWTESDLSPSGKIIRDYLIKMNGD